MPLPAGGGGERRAYSSVSRRVRQAGKRVNKFERDTRSNVKSHSNARWSPRAGQLASYRRMGRQASGERRG